MKKIHSPVPFAPHSSAQGSIIAAIDIGTNSFHLIVCDVSSSSGRFRILDREKEHVRLGSGSRDMKHLSAAAMKRGVEALKRFKRIADSFRASIRAIATSAVREALNKEDFISLVKKETGISIEIASGFEEARLIHLGVLQALPVFHKKILLIDIGGGSTEFLVGQKRNIRYGNSLKLGAVRLTQRFFQSEMTSPKEVKECRKFIKGMLAPVVREMEKFDYETAVGSSGTILSIAHIIRAAKGFDSESSLNGFSFKKKELDQAIGEILEKKTPAERAEIPGIDPARADIILAGALILEQIANELGIKEMKISEFALREGIIFDTIEKQNAGVRIDHLHDIRYSSVIHLAEQFRYEATHSRQVAKLALSLFDQTAQIHGLGKLERNYLEAAALLHEIGLFISHSQHHRHSYYLIRNAEMFGYLESEKEMIANIARYHRKSHPKFKHEGYGSLTHDQQHIVNALSSILRIADGLDRTHASSVRSVSVSRRNRSIALRIAPRRKSVPIDLELWGAEQKKSLFEETFDCTVSVKAAAADRRS
jgi:exopolyphosphatase/guanosine-5'-triphosphate,3'-diphosphate pyrophosphatase